MVNYKQLHAQNENLGPYILIFIIYYNLFCELIPIPQTPVLNKFDVSGSIFV